MNYSPEPNRQAQNGSAEETLALLASLPPPEGLVDRIHAGLRSAPAGRPVLSWPVAWRSPGNAWRGAAAAAIVCVVTGGGWQIYSRIPVRPDAPGIVVPQPSSLSGGFGAANARHVPDTLTGPVLSHRAVDPTARDDQEETNAVRARTTQPGRSGKLRKKSDARTRAVPVNH